MSEGQSQKQKDQWRSYVFSKLSEDEEVREGRDLELKEYLKRLKELHKQAGR